MHPFLEVNKLSDEEIIEKLGKAYSYMNYQISAGHGPTVNSIKEVIQSLEDERVSRIRIRSDAEFNKKYSSVQGTIEIGKLDLTPRKSV